MNLLEKILQRKKEKVEQRKSVLPLEVIMEKIKDMAPPYNFKNAINKSDSIAIIAEMKQSSPSAGLLRADYDVRSIAIDFKLGGADAVSVLTEENYFQGDIMHILTVKSITDLPVLRKDFIIDEYQVYESRYFGADAILLITGILSDEKLEKSHKIAKEVGMDVILEVENEEELSRALKISPDIIGINNRNLWTLEINMMKPYKLKKAIPDGIVVIVESGIKDKNYILDLWSLGINAVLIGEILMRSDDIKLTLKMLRGNKNEYT